MSKIIQHSPDFLTLGNEESLNEEDFRLVNAAKAACDLSYAPYSGFNVGSALLLDDGQIVKGANQENAAYPSGLCAERVALFSSSVTLPGLRIIKIATLAKRNNDPGYLSATPCGSCRQVLLEYETKQKHPIEVLMLIQNDKWIKSLKASALLPFSFNASNL